MNNLFEGLDAILAVLVPRHATTKQAVKLEPDAPERLRQIWEAVGISDFTRELEVRPRTARESEEELAIELRRWAETPKIRAVWGKTVEGIRKALPKHLRVVRVLPKQLGVTDEDTRVPDPPVLMLRVEERKALRWCGSYSDWLIWRLVRAAARKRLTGYNKRARLPATQILEQAYPPGMYQLADRIWWMEMPKFSPKAEQPTIVTTLFYASIDDYLTYAFGLTDQQRAFLSKPQGEVWWLRSPGKLDLTHGAPEGFRAMGHIGYDGKPENSVRAIGRVGSSLVWLEMVPKGDMAVTFNPTAREQVSSWLEGLGLAVKQKIPFDLDA